MDVDQVLEALQAKLATATGRPVFISRAQGRPPLPYAVLGLPPAYMPPEPPEAPVMAGTGVRLVSLVVRSFGRTAVDVFALDHRVWVELTDGAYPDDILYVSGPRSGSSEGHTDTVSAMAHAYQVAHL